MTLEQIREFINTGQAMGLLLVIAVLLFFIASKKSTRKGL